MAAQFQVFKNRIQSINITNRFRNQQTTISNPTTTSVQTTSVDSAPSLSPSPSPAILEKNVSNIQSNLSVEFDEDYIWSWQCEDEWIPYDARANDMIERAYFNGDATVILSHDIYAQDTFTINFSNESNGKFEQINNKTGDRHYVKRDPQKLRNCNILWEWKDYTNIWITYSPEDAKFIEQGYSQGEKKIRVMSKIAQLGETEVDFLTMKLLNLQTNEQCDIRRTVKFKEYTPSSITVFSPSNNFDDISECPICFQKFDTSQIVEHVNICIETLESSNNEGTSDNSRVPKNIVVKQDAYDPVNKEKFECPICFDEIAVGSGYQFKKCGHKYCGQCLTGYFSELIMNGKVTEIHCPSPKCDYECQYDDIQFIVDRDLLEKYMEFKRNAMIDADPEMRWCSNPTGCGNAFRREDTTSTRMVCDECNYEFCFKCGEEYHGNKTCEDFARWKITSNRIDIRVFLWQKLNTRPCPNCNVAIQKRGGCNHMTCQKCNHDFCWQCRKPYTSDHFEDSWCSQYGRSATLYYAKAVGKHIAKLAIPVLSFSSSDYTSSSSDDDTTIGEKFEILGEKMAEVKEEMNEKIIDVKEDISEKWQNTKEKAEETLLKFKSFWDK